MMTDMAHSTETATTAATEDCVDSLDALIAAAPVPVEKKFIPSAKRWVWFRGFTGEQLQALQDRQRKEAVDRGEVSEQTDSTGAAVAGVPRMSSYLFRERVVALSWVKGSDRRTRAVQGDEAVARMAAEMGSVTIGEMFDACAPLSGLGGEPEAEKRKNGSGATPGAF